jgi:hypothetical protein
MDSGPAYHDEDHAQVAAEQPLETPLKPAVMACLSGSESARWTLAELAERLKGIGVPFTRPGMDAHSQKQRLWSSSRVRAVLARPDAAPLNDEDKAVLVCIGSIHPTIGTTRQRISRRRVNLDPIERLNQSTE